MQKYFGNEENKTVLTNNSYYAVYKDEKWGVIDSNGNEIITPSYREMIIIPNENKDVFLCTYDINIELNTYETKVLNSKNEEIFTNYDKVEAISNMDESYNIWYEENVLRYEKDGKCGIINLSGEVLTENIYEEIVALSGIENSFVVTLDGKKGIVDNTGSIIVEPNYTEITNLGVDNKKGYIVKSEEGLYGIVDYSDNIVLETKYETIKNVYGNNYYVITESGKETLINKDGEIILKDEFDNVSQILTLEANGFIYIKDGLYGIMSFDGTVKIPNTYQYLEETRSGVFIATKDNLMGVIDIENSEKIEFKYSQIRYNSLADIYIAEDATYNADIINNNFEIKQTGIFLSLNEIKGYIELRQDGVSKYYNFNFEEKQESEIYIGNTLYLSKQNDKYGYIDKEGNVIVEYIYDDATKQNENGFAAVKLNGKWGAIDNKGNLVIETVYNLDEYLLIDFIGVWHLGKDLNMNYYTQLDK